MRDLLSRVALGTSGRWKVYIIDEVHQLTADAASALLKTLEEPPAHVVFVLATTDPQKVLPTIRSRTQHFEFRLLGADVLAGLLRDVNEQAALGLAPEAIDLVVRRGHGSARDALSVLDQVAAAGEVDDESAVIGGIVDALADQDPGRVLMAVAEAMAAGRDPGAWPRICSTTSATASSPPRPGAWSTFRTTPWPRSRSRPAGWAWPASSRPWRSSARRRSTCAIRSTPG